MFRGETLDALYVPPARPAPKTRGAVGTSAQTLARQGSTDEGILGGARTRTLHSLQGYGVVAFDRVIKISNRGRSTARRQSVAAGGEPHPRGCLPQGVDPDSAALSGTGKGARREPLLCRLSVSVADRPSITGTVKRSSTASSSTGSSIARHRRRSTGCAAKECFCDLAFGSPTSSCKAITGGRELFSALLPCARCRPFGEE